MESKRNMNDCKPSRNFLSQEEANSSQKQQEAMEKKEDSTVSQNARMYNSAIRNSPEEPVRNIIARNRFYKSKPCSEFKAGYCRKGNNCHYAHGMRDLRCDEFFQTNECEYGDNCLYQHISDPVGNFPGMLSPPIPKAWKTKMCYQWQNYGSCSFGTTCRYSHESAELQSQSNSEMPLPSNTSETTMSRDTLGDDQKQEEQSVRTSSKIVKWPRKLVGIYGDWLNEP